MKACAAQPKQRGVALWLLLIVLTMAGSFAWYRTSNMQFGHLEQDNQLASTLARAKEAVIAYAVLDEKHPGRLLCPDLIGDGISPLLSRDDCAAYSGRLPWKTLDIENSRDSHGSQLQFAISRLFGGDRSSPPLNSDTETQLTLIASDGSVHNDIAGLIIAPRGTLDPGNADGNDIYQAGSSAAEDNNDVILAITRQELMAAVEKRVANEVKSCIDQHAASRANTDHRYPWPAPFSAANQEGRAHSLFGRVPLTQPGSGTDAALKASIAKLTLARTALNVASDANQQLSPLQDLGAALLEARNLFDAIFSIANQLKQAADAVSAQALRLDNAIDAAALNGRISRSEGSGIRTLAADTDLLFATLPELLGKLGIDALPWELERQRAGLDAAGTAAALLASSTDLEQLLWATDTPRADIAPNLAAAQTAATAARLAAQAAALSADGSALANARASAISLSNALKTLQFSIEASRVSELASSVTLWSTSLDTVQAALQNAPSSAHLALLQASLLSTKTSVDGITSGVPSVINARANAVNALSELILAAQAILPDYARLASDTRTALGALGNLASAIAANEQVNNNVSQTSLISLLNIYQNTRATFNAQDTATPRPRQSDIAQFAIALDRATVNIDLWAKIIAAQAALIAPQAKANPLGDPGNATVLDGSAYKMAGDALGSITGKNKSLQLLQTYLDKQTASNQASAKAALDETVALVSSLLALAGQLDNQLSGTTASAGPIVWLASRCDFLLANTASWWNNNQWANTLFYQIGHPLQATPGTLTVNGTGTYRLVAIAAGRQLGGQNRNNASADSYFEKDNAHSTRDGDASAPTTAFTAAPSSATFNDRLAY